MKKRSIILTITLVLLTIHCVAQVNYLLSNSTSYEDSLITKMIDITLSDLNREQQVIINVSYMSVTPEHFMHTAKGGCNMTNYSYYTINVKHDLNEKTFMRVMLHELAHVRQFMTGKLRVVGSRIAYDGKMYDSHYLEHIQYALRPWEKDASQYARMSYKALRNR